MSKTKKLLIFLAIIIVSYIGYKLTKVVQQKQILSNASKTVEGNEYLIKEINDEEKARTQKVYQEYLHSGGKALFVGTYRFEFAMIKKAPTHSLLVVYIDNMKGDPSYPNRTNLEVKIKNNKYKLIAIKNGVMIGSINQDYSLEDSIQILGVFSDKKLAFSTKLKKFSAQME